MKKTTHRFTALATVALASALLLGACGSQKASSVRTSSSSSKTVQSTSSSSKKAVKKTKASSSSSASQEDAVASASSETSPASSAPAASSQATQATTPQQGQAPASASTQAGQGEGTQTGKGGWNASNQTGVLDFSQDTPVHVAPDKNSAIAFTQPANTSLEWDNYTINSDENWYTVVVKNGDTTEHYYVAYSDVGH